MHAELRAHPCKAVTTRGIDHDATRQTNVAETTIVTVTGRKQQDDFIRVADRIYKDCPQYVPDFRKDLRDMLSQRRQEELAACQLQAFPVCGICCLRERVFRARNAE